MSVLIVYCKVTNIFYWQRAGGALFFFFFCRMRFAPAMNCCRKPVAGLVGGWF